MFQGYTTAYRRATAWLLALSAAAITACGGGGAGPATPTQATPAATPPAAESATAYAAGPISGFGSVIVNDIRYEDSDATVTDDEEREARGRLKLGMLVEIDSQAIDRSRGVAKAMRIRFGSEIVGMVTAVDSEAGTLVVLGQTVAVTDTTVFDDRLDPDLSKLAGTVVEVHAQFDAAGGSYTARRIEPAADAQTYKLRGVVADLAPAARAFSVGGQAVSYAGLKPSDLPPRFADGMLVRVWLQKTQVDGKWVAVAVRHGAGQPAGNRDEARVRGAVTARVSDVDFEVDGIKVDARQAAVPAGIVLGALVQVEGRIVDGIVIAEKIAIDKRPAKDRYRYELHGAVGALDRNAKTFMLRGTRVSYAGLPSFTHGTEADLANGRKVAVTGNPGTDRKTLVATSIDFED